MHGTHWGARTRPSGPVICDVVSHKMMESPEDSPVGVCNRKVVLRCFTCLTACSWICLGAFLGFAIRVWGTQTTVTPSDYHASSVMNWAFRTPSVILWLVLIVGGILLAHASLLLLFLREIARAHRTIDRMLDKDHTKDSQQ